MKVYTSSTALIPSNCFEVSCLVFYKVTNHVNLGEIYPTIEFSYETNNFLMYPLLNLLNGTVISIMHRECWFTTLKIVWMGKLKSTFVSFNCVIKRISTLTFLVCIICF